MRRRREDIATRRRRVSHAGMARISPLPPPEEIFADWLLSLPHGANIEAAARREIELIDRSANFHPDVQCLRMLLVAVAGDGCRRPPLRNP